MAGIHGMKVDDLAINYAESVLSGKDKGVWATFGYYEDEDDLLMADVLDRNVTGLGPKGRWNSFVKHLEMIPDDVRYGIVEFSHTNKRENVTRSKRIFVLWAPSAATTKSKLLATMHLKDVKDQLAHGSCSIVIQATCVEDLQYSTVLQRIKSKTSVF